MVKITGVKAHLDNLRRIAGPEMDRQMGAILTAAGQIVEKEAQRLIKDGDQSGAAHVVSAPGQPPNREWGGLDESIETNLVGPRRAEVSANAPYAVALEFGTSKMAARPYMAPALANKRQEVVETIAAGVRKVLRGGKVVP